MLCGAAGMLPGNTVPETPMLLSRQVWDTHRSQPVPLWASQLFLTRSAQPAGKTHIVPQHPGGWTEPPAWERDAGLGCGARSRSVGSRWSRQWQQLLCETLSSGHRDTIAGQK